jgi:hypothetical protein
MSISLSFTVHEPIYAPLKSKVVKLLNLSYIESILGEKKKRSRGDEIAQKKKISYKFR